MSHSDTLIIKRLSSKLSFAEKEEFLKFFGATSTKIIESAHKKRCIAFARFEYPEVAEKVLHTLHQSEVYGEKLIVEYAERDLRWKEETEKKDENSVYESFLKKLNSWTQDLNFELPPPCHLRYEYPLPTAEVLCNIANMLAVVPKFYTQVLHLMNKMNLPCPFESSFPLQDNEVFRSLSSAVNDSYEKLSINIPSDDTGSETELETDEDVKTKEIQPKRKLSVKRKVKKLKFIKPLPASTSKPIDISQVFESFSNQSKKIEVILPKEINIDCIKDGGKSSTASISEGFGVLYPQKVDKNKPEKEELEIDLKSCITSEELAANRISEKDFRCLSVFQKYEKGYPSCRLYIKNLSKHVTKEDLSHIYGKYMISGIDEQGTMFDIRLMQEGRMKGQAFVTLQNVQQAELALKETNGYILKDKPMVVQFARSAK